MINKIYAFIASNRLPHLFAVLFSCLLVLEVQAADTTHTHTSPYAGEEARQIKSLSPSDIKALRAGSGWGLAKAAELNGVPGPLHLLEMKDAISLTAEQIQSIETIFDDMNKQAVMLGEKLITQETELDALFKNGVPEPAVLEALVNEVGKTRSALRYAHLQAHLKTPELLTAQQLEKYNQVRGYASGDPCESVPEGHDPVMWKKHNGCN